MKCRECGYEYTGSPKFCPECGRSTVVGKIICRRCSREIDGNLKYCPECGEPIKSDYRNDDYNRRKNRDDDDNDDDEGGILGGIGEIVGKLFGG